MGSVIGILAIKGGVGKTTISSSLAADLANHYKKRVLLIDANFSVPNLGLHMDIVAPEKTIHDVLAGKVKLAQAVHKRYGVDVIPGSMVYNETVNPLKLRDKIASIKNAYDYIILDSSPSLNEEVLSTMIASDHLFVVTTPDYPTLSCSLRAAKLAKQRGKPIVGIIINKIRDPNYELSLHHIEEATGIPVVARIPDDGASVRALFTRIPISVYNQRSKFSKELSRLSAALTMSKEPRAFWRTLLPFDIKPEEVNRSLMKQHFYSSIFEQESNVHG